VDAKPQLPNQQEQNTNKIEIILCNSMAFLFFVEQIRLQNGSGKELFRFYWYSVLVGWEVAVWRPLSLRSRPPIH